MSKGDTDAMFLVFETAKSIRVQEHRRHSSTGIVYISITFFLRKTLNRFVVKKIGAGGYSRGD